MLLLTLFSDVVATPVPALHVGVAHCAVIVLVELHVTVPDTDQPVNTILVRVNAFPFPHAGNVNVVPWLHVNDTFGVPVCVTPLTVNEPEPPFLLIVIVYEIISHPAYNVVLDVLFHVRADVPAAV